jgi:hypothetical protein
VVDADALATGTATASAATTGTTLTSLRRVIGLAPFLGRRPGLPPDSLEPGRRLERTPPNVEQMLAAAERRNS